jgi:hypothetical protein
VYYSGELKDRNDKTGHTYCGCECEPYNYRRRRVRPTPPPTLTFKSLQEYFNEPMVECAYQGYVCPFETRWRTKTIRYVSLSDPSKYEERTVAAGGQREPTTGFRISPTTMGMSCSNKYCITWDRKQYCSGWEDPHPYHYKKCFIVVPACEDTTWVKYTGQHLAGHDTKTVNVRNVHECKSHCCDAEDTYGFRCASFDYDPNKNTCFLSGQVATEIGGLTTNDGSYDHYAKVPRIDTFVEWMKWTNKELTSTQLFFRKSITGLTLDQCKAQCWFSGMLYDFTCRSFDFAKGYKAPTIANAALALAARVNEKPSTCQLNSARRHGADWRPGMPWTHLAESVDNLGNYFDHYQVPESLRDPWCHYGGEDPDSGSCHVEGVTGIVVTGAGSAEWNGLYLRLGRPPFSGITHGTNVEYTPSEKMKQCSGAKCSNKGMCDALAKQIGHSSSRTLVHDGWRHNVYPGGCFLEIASKAWSKGKTGDVKTFYWNPNTASNRIPTWADYRFVCDCNDDGKIGVWRQIFPTPNSAHEIYRENGKWRLGTFGTATAYRVKDGYQPAAGNLLPPDDPTSWVAAYGVAPMPQLRKLSECVAADEPSYGSPCMDASDLIVWNGGEPEWDGLYTYTVPEVYNIDLLQKLNKIDQNEPGAREYIALLESNLTQYDESFPLFRKDDTHDFYRYNFRWRLGRVGETYAYASNPSVLPPTDKNQWVTGSATVDKGGDGSSHMPIPSLQFARSWPIKMKTCAYEDEVCVLVPPNHASAVPEHLTVRYVSTHNPSKFHEKVIFGDKIGCNNAVFGDPDPGPKKVCLILNPIAPIYGTDCIHCWCEEQHGDSYEKCTSETPPNRLYDPNNGGTYFGGTQGFKCLRNENGLVFRAKTRNDFLKKFRTAECEPFTDVPTRGVEMCVTFPWVPRGMGIDMIDYAKDRIPTKGESSKKLAPSKGAVEKIAKALKFLGDFNFCNRPATQTSYLVISTAESPAGFSASGRIDWPCEWGYFQSNCNPYGGLISFTKEWLGAKTDRKTYKDLRKSKTAAEVISISGKTSFFLGLHRSFEHGGLDFRVGLEGSVDVSVLNIVGAGARVSGYLTIKCRPAPLKPKFGGTAKFEAEVFVLAIKFRVTVWLTIDDTGFKFKTSTPEDDNSPYRQLSAEQQGQR